MNLLDTQLGTNWLSQFNERPADNALARILVESLRLVSHCTFRYELRKATNDAAETVGGPISLYAVRGLPKEDSSYFEDQKSCPAAVGDVREIGSEGILANVATALNREDSNRFLNHPPIMTLRKRRCRDVFLLTDLAGSGHEVAKFIRAILRERHLKSWWSFGWMTFHVVAFAVSEQAEEYIRRSLQTTRSDHARTHLRFWYARRPVAGPELWTGPFRNEIEDLCSRYGKRCKLGWMFEKGYCGSMGAVVFAHGCPNNVPGILWRQTPGWSALFPNRAIPEELTDCFDKSASATSPASLLHALDAAPLAHEKVLDRLSPLGQSMVLVLAALGKKITSLDRLSLATNLSLPECSRLLGECRSFRLIDAHGHLTRLGREELHAVERLGKLPFEPPAFDGSFYFPNQLRAARK